MEDIAKNSPDFKDYLSGYSCHMGIISVTDQKNVSFDKIDLFTCPAKDVCIISIGKVKDKKKVLAERKKAEKYTLKIPVSRFAHKWHHAFSKKELQKLFSRYYIDGFTDFCLVITIENTENLPLYYFLLPKHLLKYAPDKFSAEQLHMGVDNYYRQWIDSIRGEFGNRCMSKADFIKFLGQIRNIVEQFEVKTALTKKDCGLLNNLYKQLPKDTEITSDIVNSFFSSFAKDLMKNKRISQCQLCSDYFLYKPYKKYCSLHTEGKDCGKKARNKRYYSVKGKKRLPKYRKATRELRAFYKEKGIKK